MHNRTNRRTSISRTNRQRTSKNESIIDIFFKNTKEEELSKMMIKNLGFDIIVMSVMAACISLIKYGYVDYISFFNGWNSEIFMHITLKRYLYITIIFKILIYYIMAYVRKNKSIIKKEVDDIKGSIKIKKIVIFFSIIIYSIIYVDNTYNNRNISYYLEQLINRHHV